MKKLTFRLKTSKSLKITRIDHKKRDAKREIQRLSIRVLKYVALSWGQIEWFGWFEKGVGEVGKGENQS